VIKTLAQCPLRVRPIEAEPVLQMGDQFQRRRLCRLLGIPRNEAFEPHDDIGAIRQAPKCLLKCHHRPGPQGFALGAEAFDGVEVGAQLERGSAV
jgi:hypothetical protein